jgi:hypothetical protein
MKIKNIFTGGVTGGLIGGLIVTLILIFTTMIPDMQANGGLRQWFIYHSRIAGFGDLLTTFGTAFSICFVLGFIGGALGADKLTNIKRQDYKGQLKHTAESTGVKSNKPNEPGIKTGVKGGVLGLAATLLLLLLCIFFIVFAEMSH